MKSDSLNSNFACARFHQVPSDRTRTKFIRRLRLDSSSALCVKNFRESYVFHCLVIKVSVVFDSLSHLFELVKNFFQVFSKLFFRCSVVGCLLTTCSLYHVFSHLSTTFFIFWKTFNFSHFQKQLFPTAQLDYHSRIHLSTTFFIFFQISFHNAEATLLSGVPVVLSISAYFFQFQMQGLR